MRYWRVRVLVLLAACAQLPAATVVLYDASTATPAGTDLIAPKGPLAASFSTGSVPLNLTDVKAIFSNGSSFQLTNSSGVEPSSATTVRHGEAGQSAQRWSARKSALGALALLPPPSSGTSVALFSDSSTHPGALLQAIGTLADTSLPMSGAKLFDFPVTPSIQLSANTRYWIVFASAASSPAGLVWSEDSSGTGVASQFNLYDGEIFSNSNGPYQLKITAQNNSLVPSLSGTLSITGAKGNDTSTPPAYVQNPNAFAFSLTDGIQTISGQERRNNDPVGGPNTALQNMTTFDGRQATITATIPALNLADVAAASGGSQVFAIGLLTEGELTAAATTYNGSLGSTLAPGTSSPGTAGFDGIIIGVAATGSGSDVYLAGHDLGASAGCRICADLTQLGYASSQAITKPLNLTIAFDGTNMTVTLNGAVVGMPIPFSHDLSSCVLVAMGFGLDAADGMAAMTYSASVSNPATVGPPSLVYAVSGDTQTGLAGTELSAPLVVGVVDSYRNLVPGATVSFTSVNASVNPESAQTDENGQASTQVTLGSAVGPATVTATVSGIPAITFHLTANANPDLPTIAAVENGASFVVGGPVSAGSLATIFGTGFGAQTVATSVPLPLQLANTSLTVNNVPAPLIFVNPSQINFQVPVETAAGPAMAIVTFNSFPSAAFTFQVAAAAPGIFLYDTTRAIAQNYADNSLNGPNSPAAPGDFLVVYLTGQGPVSGPALTDGVPLPAPPPLFSATLPSSATIGGKDATMTFLGLTPGFIGLAQADIQVPQLAPAGDYPLVITINGVKSNAPVVSVK
jgi:uncharacterized protein (TIGR03437 family)